jgi:predicted XRE-type DNA-binding protein
VKLTANQVADIRHAYEHAGALQSQLAAVYGVSQSTISDIIHRKNWK